MDSFSTYAIRETGEAQTGVKSMLAVVEKHYVFICAFMRKISLEKDNREASNSGYL